MFGNGGLYSFTGWFYSKKLRRYRLFGTDLSQAVVLAMPPRTVVVTPAEPDEFIRHVREMCPFVAIDPVTRDGA